jgi:hypothetical protein
MKKKQTFSAEGIEIGKRIWKTCLNITLE